MGAYTFADPWVRPLDGCSPLDAVPAGITTRGLVEFRNKITGEIIFPPLSMSMGSVVCFLVVFVTSAVAERRGL